MYVYLCVFYHCWGFVQYVIIFLTVSPFLSILLPPPFWACLHRLHTPRNVYQQLFSYCGGIVGEEPSICHYKILSVYWLISLRSWLTKEELFCKDPTALCMILSISLCLITNRFDQVISDIRRCLSACEKTTPIVL